MKAEDQTVEDAITSIKAIHEGRIRMRQISLVGNICSLLANLTNGKSDLVSSSFLICKYLFVFYFIKKSKRFLHVLDDAESEIESIYDSAKGKHNGDQSCHRCNRDSKRIPRTFPWPALVSLIWDLIRYRKHPEKEVLTIDEAVKRLKEKTYVLQTASKEIEGNTIKQESALNLQRWRNTTDAVEMKTEYLVKNLPFVESSHDILDELKTNNVIISPPPFINTENKGNYQATLEPSMISAKQQDNNMREAAKKILSVLRHHLEVSSVASSIPEDLDTLNEIQRRMLEIEISLIVVPVKQQAIVEVGTTVQDTVIKTLSKINNFKPVTQQKRNAGVSRAINKTEQNKRSEILPRLANEMFTSLQNTNLELNGVDSSVGRNVTIKRNWQLDLKETWVKAAGELEKDLDYLQSHAKQVESNSLHERVSKLKTKLSSPATETAYATLQFSDSVLAHFSREANCQNTHGQFSVFQRIRSSFTEPRRDLHFERKLQELRNGYRDLKWEANKLASRSSIGFYCSEIAKWIGSNLAVFVDLVAIGVDGYTLLTQRKTHPREECLREELGKPHDHQENERLVQVERNEDVDNQC